MNDQKYLQHFGVLGMKWGVRKRRESSGGSNFRKKRSLVQRIAQIRKNKKNSSEKNKKKSTKNVKKMSTEELQNKISRLELEKKYRDLKASEKTRGRKVVDDILYDSAKNIGTQLVTYAMGSAVNKAVAKGVSNAIKDSDGELSEAMKDALKGVVNPRKGQTDKKK